MDNLTFTFITGKQETHGGAASATKARTYYSVLGTMESSATPEQIRKHVKNSRNDVGGNGVFMLILCAVLSAISLWMIRSDIQGGFFLLAFVGGAIVLFFMGLSNIIKALKQKHRTAKMADDEIISTFAEEAAIRNVQIELFKKLPKQKNVTFEIFAFEVHKAAKGVFEKNPFSNNEGLLEQLRVEMQAAAKDYVSSLAENKMQSTN